MKTLLQHFYEKVRASAWTVPAVLAIFAIALSRFTLWADEVFRGSDLTSLDWICPASAEGAKTLLSTIAASMLGVAGVSFSSIMVTMTLASQQFGPRLLRNFIKDKFSQTVLGALIGTFIFCLFTLRGIRTDEGILYVPQISTTVGLVLALTCLALFIRFVHHIISEIQAEEVSHNAYLGLEEAITAVFPDPKTEDLEYRVTDNELTGWEILAGKTGYVQALNLGQLVEVAEKYAMVLEVNCRAGHFITERQGIVTVVEGPSPDDCDPELISEIQKSFFVGQVRTPEQDFEYGIRQLVEVALRALSPGINDPFTAINCIDFLGAGLQSVFARPLPGSVHRDDTGNIRVFSWPVDYAGVVEAALNQVRQASSDRCDVSCHLIEMLTKTARTAEIREQQDALLIQASLINQDSLRAMSNDHDCEAIRSRFAVFVQACHLIEPFEDLRIK